MMHAVVLPLVKLRVALLLAVALLVVSMPHAAHAQPTERPFPAPLELDFEQGDLGQTPQDWSVPSAGWQAGLTDAKAADGRQALLLEQQEATDAPFGTVMCMIDATPYRGKAVSFTARMLVEGPNSSQAMMWLRADLEDGTTGAFDNMQDRPLRPDYTGEWTTASIELDIEPNAAELAIGFLAYGGATVYIDSVRLAVDTTRPAPQTPSEPAPLSERGLENLEAATRLLAYVRFFHASDQAVAVKYWDHLAVALIEQAEPAEDPADLADRLSTFFAPLAPTLQIWAGGSDDAPALTDPPESAKRTLYWKHDGVGILEGRLPQNVYSSAIQRDRLPFRLRWGTGKFDPKFYEETFLIKPLGGGVTCRLPVKVFADDEGTLPHLPTESPWVDSTRQPKLTADNRSTRLAGVALCWGVMQHFYPYFDVVETDWDAVLSAALRNAAEDTDRTDYLHTLQELIAQLHDGHGQVSAVGLTPRTMLPLAFSWVGDQLIVAGVDGSARSKVNVGDEVLTIDRTTVADWTETFSKRTSAATDGWRRTRLAYDLAHSLPSPDTVPLTLRRPDGQEYQTTVTRIPITQVETRTDRRPKDGSEVAPGIVYFNLDGATSEAFDAVLPQLAAAKGIVFDLRGYPGDAGISVVSHLSPDVVRSARWNTPIATVPDREGWQWNSNGRWTLPPRTPRLTAHIAFLTDGRAISYAESIMGIVEAYHMGEIVGSTTAGTNGNVNPYSLPGGYRVLWTGMRVLKHDGSQHHGVGIAPTVPVEPTVAGIAADRDEVLEKGVDVLRQKIEAEPEH